MSQTMRRSVYFEPESRDYRRAEARYYKLRNDLDTLQHNLRHDLRSKPEDISKLHKLTNKCEHLKGELEEAKLDLDYQKHLERDGRSMESITILAKKKEIHEKNRLRNQELPIFVAITNDRLDLVEEALREGEDINCFGRAGFTPLAAAAQLGKLKIVKFLLGTDGAACISRDRSGLTPLLLASQWGHIDIVKYLLGMGNSQESKTLSQREISDDPALSCGVDINSTDGMLRNALSYSAENGHLEIVALLLEKGLALQVNSPDNVQRTPLSWAAANGRKHVVKLLLDVSEQKGLNPNIVDIYSRTPLFWAASNGDVETVDCLLKQAGNLDAEDKDGHTPLSVATENGHDDVGRKILDQFELRVTTLTWTSLKIREAARRGWKQFLDFFIKECDSRGLKYSVNYPNPDERNRTPMCYAAIGGYTGVMEILIEAGADIEPESGWSDTPLCLAAEYKQLDTVRYLLSAGADVRVTNHKHLRPLDLVDDEPIITGMLAKVVADGPLRFEDIPCPAIDGKFKAVMVDFFPNDSTKGGKENRNVERIVVQDLLSSKKSIRDVESSFTWLHLPANNMRWIEVLIGKYCKQEYGQAELAYKILKPERWVDRQNRSSNEHVHHARFMRPLYQLILEVNPPTVISKSTVANREKSLVFIMPYLHWELEPILMEWKKHIKTLSKNHDLSKGSDSKTTENDKPHENLQGNPQQMTKEETSRELELMETYLYDKHPLHMRRTLDQYYYHTLQDTDVRDQSQVGPRYQERHKDKSARVLTMVDQLWLWVLVGKNGKADTVISSFPARAYQPRRGGDWNVANPDPDGLTDVLSNTLLSISDDPAAVQTPYDLAGVIISECAKVYLNTADARNPEIRFSATYENAIGDVSDIETKRFGEFQKVIKREVEVYKGQSMSKNDGKTDTEKLIDVIQLDIIEERTIEAVEEVLERFYNPDQLDLGKAIKSLRKGERDYISGIVEVLREINHSESLTEQMKSLEIGVEIEQLREVKDILDELNIMLTLFENQRKVLKSMEASVRVILKDRNKAFKIENPHGVIEALEAASDTDSVDQNKGGEMIDPSSQSLEERHEAGERLSNSQRKLNSADFESKIWQSTSSTVQSLPLSTVQSNLEEIKQMVQRAHRVYDSLNILVDLKQKQSDTMEARFSRKELEESVQLTKAARMQTQQSAKQGKTIMVFTMVTIIFLPLSFMAAFMAIDIKQFPKDANGGGMGLGWVSKVMFPVSGVTSIFLVYIAFNMARIEDLWESLMKRMGRKSMQVNGAV